LEIGNIGTGYFHIGNIHQLQLKKNVAIINDCGEMKIEM